MRAAQIALATVCFPACAAFAVLLRLILQIFNARKRRRSICRSKSNAVPLVPKLDSAIPRSYRLLCVLGSGGHTAEMVTLLADLFDSPTAPSHVTYVTSATDDHSASKAARLHLVCSEKTGVTAAAAPASEPVFICIPRAREVGEGWISSARSALRCLLWAGPAVARARPDVVLVNGPGNAVVVVTAALILNAVGVLRARCVYVESVARTRSLSLSGRVLYHVAHRFLVQWPRLARQYPMAEFHGRLC
jgi:beta-1,4-N-acetylglucosaminyltransferase